MAPQSRVTTYTDDPAPVKVYYSPTDRKLLAYGCKDAWVAYRACEISWMGMKSQFSDHPNARWKASRRRLKWYSHNMWSKILMEESGVPFDTDRLVNAHEKYEAILAECLNEARKDFGCSLSGPGSQGSIQQLFTEAHQEIEIALGTDLSLDRYAVDRDLSILHGIEPTKTGLLRTDADTSNAMQGIAPTGTRAARTLALLAEVRGAMKILGTYTGPRLYGKETGKGTKARFRRRLRMKGGTLAVSKYPLQRKRNYIDHLIRVYSRSGAYTGVAIGYPSWFFLPKSNEKGKAGGVRQFRWSAKGPAIQTDPPLLKKCMTSRYRHGIIGNGDYSQMEWRMAAFISDDYTMLREIEAGIDPHIGTACFLLDIDLTNKREVRQWLKQGAIQTLCRCPKYKMRTEARRFARCKSSGYPKDFLSSVVAFCRQEAGKSENFGYLYGAGAPTILATVRTKSGFEVPLSRCQDMIDRNNKKYKELHAMRKSDMDEAVQLGALHLPILGQSRTFSDCPRDIRGKYRGQVYDLKIQALSGLVLQSAIVETQQFQTESDLPFHVIINNHDAMAIDSRVDVAPEVFKFARCKLLDNWYLRKLESHYGRKFPIKVEMEVLATRGVRRDKADEMMSQLNREG